MMGNEPQMLEQSEAAPEGRPGKLTWLAWLAVTLMLAAVGFYLGTRMPGGPGANSTEVGFTRDMITHHAQAVDMATLLRDRSDDPELRQITLDMMLTQQAQIGQMQGWLNAWGYPQASTAPAMAWMGMSTEGLMPGMASPDQLNHLRMLAGVEAERQFLTLMIAHHQAGVAMAQAVLEMTKQPVVSALAQSIVSSQSSEIALMQSLLAARGGPPADTGASMDHSGTEH